MINVILIFLSHLFTKVQSTNSSFDSSLVSPNWQVPVHLKSSINPPYIKYQNIKNQKMPAKCKAYTIKCKTCHEQFTTTKCDHPLAQAHHTYAAAITHKQLSHLRARIKGLSVNCWHCDPEARLDFSSCRRSGSTARSRYSPTLSLLLHKKGASSSTSRVGIRRLRWRRRCSSWKKVVVVVPSPRASFWCWGEGRQRRRQQQQRRRQEEEPKPRPYDLESVQSTGTVDVWKLPRLFPRRDSHAEMS